MSRSSTETHHIIFIPSGEIRKQSGEIQLAKGINSYSKLLLHKKPSKLHHRQAYDCRSTIQEYKQTNKQQHNPTCAHSQ